MELGKHFVSQCPSVYPICRHCDHQTWVSYMYHGIYRWRGKNHLVAHIYLDTSMVITVSQCQIIPDSKVHGTNMGPTWVLSAPCGPHVGPMNLAIRDPLTTTVLRTWFYRCFFSCQWFRMNLLIKRYLTKCPMNPHQIHQCFNSLTFGSAGINYNYKNLSTIVNNIVWWLISKV